MAHSKSEIKKAKNLLNKYAPKGEQLAYINPKEANLLKRMGGAGKDVNVSGIKSYFDPGKGSGSVSESLSEAAGLGSSTSNNNNNNNSDNNSPQRQPPSYRSVAPKTAAPKNLLSQAGSGIVNYIKTGGTIGLIARTIGKVFKNIGGRITQTKNKIGIDDAKFSNSFFVPESKAVSSAVRNYNFNRNNNNNGGDNTPPARNVGGRIIKLSPTAAEVSQSGAADADGYDSRKTKARGRSMTIRTSSKGVTGNTGAVLGTKSLLGTA
jgi:hypothetical protein